MLATILPFFFYIMLVVFYFFGLVMLFIFFSGPVGLAARQFPPVLGVRGTNPTIKQLA